MSLDLPRLKLEYEKLKELNENSDLVEIKPKNFVVENAPIEYEIEYFCLGLYKDHKSKKIHILDPRINNDPHIMLIVLPAEFPAFQPELIFKSKIFHPNINDPTAPVINFESFRPGHVCYAAWKPGRSLQGLVLEIGEMIQFKRLGILERGKFDTLPTPICREALRYLKLSLQDRFKLLAEGTSISFANIPLDNRSLTKKVEKILQAELGQENKIIEIIEEKEQEDSKLKKIVTESNEPEPKKPEIIEITDVSEENDKTK